MANAFTNVSFDPNFAKDMLIFLQCSLVAPLYISRPLGTSKNLHKRFVEFCLLFILHDPVAKLYSTLKNMCRYFRLKIKMLERHLSCFFHLALN